MATKLATITTANTDTTIHTVSANRVCKVNGILVTNRNASEATVEIYDGPSANNVKKVVLIVGPRESFLYNEVKPEFTNQVVAKSDVSDVDVVIDYEER